MDTAADWGTLGCGPTHWKFSGEGGRLPNPHILIRPFVQREAVLSSKIEGTQATLGELLAAEAGAIVDRSPEDLREVGNYVVALEHGISRLKKLLLCVKLTREMHEKLMTGVQGHQAAPGHFRKIQNWIGKPGSTVATASYIPPPPGEVEPCLAAWEKFLHESTLPPLVTIALAHYQLEAIHPFLDGNGRVGRLLITLSVRASSPARLLIRTRRHWEMAVVRVTLITKIPSQNARLLAWSAQPPTQSWSTVQLML